MEYQNNLQKLFLRFLTAIFIAIPIAFAMPLYFAFFTPHRPKEDELLINEIHKLESKRQIVVNTHITIRHEAKIFNTGLKAGALQLVYPVTGRIDSEIDFKQISFNNLEINETQIIISLPPRTISKVEVFLDKTPHITVESPLSLIAQTTIDINKSPLLGLNEQVVARISEIAYPRAQEAAISAIAEKVCSLQLLDQVNEQAATTLSKLFPSGNKEILVKSSDVSNCTSTILNHHVEAIR